MVTQKVREKLMCWVTQIDKSQAISNVLICMYHYSLRSVGSMHGFLCNSCMTRVFIEMELLHTLYVLYLVSE